MTFFSTLRHFGDNFGNQDVACQVSLFLDQGDKCAMSRTARGVHQALKKFLPTPKFYKTTVKPNLVSAFSFDNDVYSTPIETFQVSQYGNFGNFYQSLITHVGANENKDYYSSWCENQFKLRRGGARSKRGEIDLYISDLPSRDEEFLVERFRSSIDTRLSDHHCLKYTDEIKEAIMENTSIVDLSAYSQISSCRCNLFECISVRSTDLVTLHLVGDTCGDTTQMISESCVDGLKNLSITASDSSYEIQGTTVDAICNAVADIGILEILEIGNVVSDNEEWAEGLVRVLGTCPISSLRVDETFFEENCMHRMVHTLPKLKAVDVKFTSCDFGNWGKPVFDALFSNTFIQWLDLSFTEMGDDSIDSLTEMIKRGTLTRLAIGGCGIGRDEIKVLLNATTHDGSNLEFISIFDNDVDHHSVYEGLEETSLWDIHVGELRDDSFVEDHVCNFDTRDSDDCFNEGGGVWPWVTKSHVWTYGSENSDYSANSENSDGSDDSDDSE